MSSFENLRIVDNFYQTSLFFPMPTVIVSTLCEDGSTSCGPYSLVQPYYVAGKDFYAMLLNCRNSSNTAQHILANGNKHWALLNLVCVILTFLVLLPVFRINKKYRQRSYSKDKIDKIEVYTEWIEDSGGQVSDLVKKVYKSLKDFLVRMTIGVVIEIYFVIAAIIAFILTENIRTPMVMSDNWTWLMVLILGLAILTDIICFRFYGEHPYMIEDTLKDFAERYNNGEDFHGSQPTTV